MTIAVNVRVGTDGSSIAVNRIESQTGNEIRLTDFPIEQGWCNKDPGSYIRIRIL